MRSVSDRFSMLACSFVALGVFALGVKAGSDADPAVVPRDSAGQRNSTVAVLDVSRVFEEYTTFANELKRIKDEMALTHTELLDLKGEADALQEAIESLEEGTLEHIEKKADLAAIGFKVERLKKEWEEKFLEKERVVYAKALERMKMVVDMYAKGAGIDLIIRFSSQDADLSDRGELIKAINRPIVYQNGLDITDDVIAMLNRVGEAVKTEP